MINYLAALLGLALMGAITTAAIYRGDAANWHEKFTELQASYASAADKARNDAAAQEKKDLANLQSQSSQAISNAQAGQKQAQEQLKTYQAKLAAAATVKDLGHRCAGVEIPKELIP